jgi:hypothetical protein
LGVGCWVLVVGCWLLVVVGCWLFVVVDSEVMRTPTFWTPSAVTLFETMVPIYFLTLFSLTDVQDDDEVVEESLSEEEEADPALTDHYNDYKWTARMTSSSTRIPLLMF